MKCSECKSFWCEHRTTDAQKECVYGFTNPKLIAETPQPLTKELIDYYNEALYEQDWKKFRKEAAKDILCSVVANPGRIGHVEYGSKDYRKSEYVRFAIDCADELIKQLKEEK